MSVKKYLSLEEAAQILGVRSDEVIRLRERGELRGFADRGTWKFKSDDVEECKRRRQPDSNPDVPLMSDDDDTGIGRRDPASDSDVRLMVADDVRGQLTGSKDDVPVVKQSDSDSDVRLVGQSKVKKGSDSDVKLIKPKDSDSDVKLSDSDSDVRLASGAVARGADSDSDVRLARPPYSDSDVKLLDPAKAGLSGTVVNSSDSGAIDAMNSVMMDEEAPLSLHADSGIQLRRPADSGILLEHPRGKGEDNSVLNLVTDSSLKLKGSKSSPRLGKQPPKTMVEDDLDATAPMLLRDDDDEANRTDPEVPLLLKEDDEDDLMPKNFLSGGPDTDETSVIMFDEEEETVAAPAKRKPGKTDTEESEFDLEEADELEVSDEVLGEDDELEDLEVFESEDSDFEAGVSASDFPVTGAARMSVPVEHEWGAGSMLLAAASALLLVFGAWVGADLLHTVSGAGGAVGDGPFIGMFGSLFK